MSQYPPLINEILNYKIYSPNLDCVPEFQQVFSLLVGLNDKCAAEHISDESYKDALNVISAISNLVDGLAREIHEAIENTNFEERAATRRRFNDWSDFRLAFQNLVMDLRSAERKLHSFVFLPKRYRHHNFHKRLALAHSSFLQSKTFFDSSLLSNLPLSMTLDYTPLGVEVEDALQHEDVKNVKTRRITTLSRHESSRSTLLDPKKSLRMADARKLLQYLPHVNSAYDSSLNVAHSHLAEGTRSCVIDEIARWANATTVCEKALALTGPAGIGKSTIAHAMCRMLHKDGMLGASFSFHHGSEGLNDARILVPSIIHQLVANRPDIATPILEAVKANSGELSALYDPEFAVQSLIVHPLKSFRRDRTVPRIFLVIDGLDECIKPDTDALHQVLKSLGDINIISVLITSRLTPRTNTLLSTVSHHLNIRRIELQNIPHKTVSMDIEQYLDSRLKGSARIHAFYATNPNILSVLVEHAEGNFACADAMATNLVANLESWKTLNLNQLANRLMKNVFTSQLDYLYTSALPSEEEIDQLALDKEDIAEVFSTLTVLREPLSLQSIESISNIPAEQVIEVIENFQSVVWISEGQNSVIRFIHSSFSDFLVDKSRYLASTIPTNVPEYNNRLAVSCLQLLNGSSIRHEKICQFLGCSTPSLHSGVQHDRVKKGIPPPLRYACLHWFAHLSSGNVTETAIEQFERFLSTRSLVWLEYLEVLGKLDIAAEILLNARIWYEKQALKDEYSTLDLIEEVLIELEESQKVETTSIYQRSNQSRTSLASSHCNTHISRGSRRMARRDFTPADLSSYIHRDQSMCVGGGSHADVYKGFYINGSINTEVAIKVVRSHFCIDERKQEVNKRIRREIWFWQRLNHPNILPFLGVTSGFGIYLSMVCPWMKDGNLGEYLTNTEITLTLKRRQKLLEDVVAGIQYLHSQAIIHGDLNSANILIHEDKACLSDFGLSCFISRFNGPSFMRSTVGGAARWTAPELYFEHPKITKACDVYSFGCVALHVFSGEIPFCNITSAYEVRVLMELMQGRHPPRPIKHILTDVYWDFILFCWGTCMEDRPDIAEANTRLLKINNDPSGRQSGGVINQLREDEALQFQILSTSTSPLPKSLELMLPGSLDVIFEHD